MAGQLTYKFGWLVEVEGFVPAGGALGSMDTGRTVALANGLALTEPFLIQPQTKAKVWSWREGVEETFVSMMLQSAGLGGDAGGLWVEVKADKPTSSEDLTPLTTHEVFDCVGMCSHLPLLLGTQNHLVDTAQTGSFLDRLIAATAEVGLIYEVWVYNPDDEHAVRCTVTRAS